MKAFDARTCVTAGDSGLESLHNDWHKRRQAILKLPCKRKEKGLAESQCLREGCYHCRSSQSHPGLWKWVQSTRRALQHLFRPRTTALEDLMHGMVVLVWVGSVIDEPDSKLQYKFTHVPLHYLRPWRPTLLELQLAGRRIVDLSAFFPSTPKADAKKDDIALDLKPMYDEQNKPMLRSMVEFLASLDRTASWRVEALRLSSSPAPYPESCGCVRVCGADIRGTESAEISMGDIVEQPWLDADEGNDGDVSDDNNDDDDAPSGNPNKEAEISQGQTHPSVSGGVLQMTPALVKVWDDICEQNAKAESSSSSSNSTTSSSSSSSSAKTKTSDDPKQPIANSGSTSMAVADPPASDTGGVLFSRQRDIHNKAKQFFLLNASLACCCSVSLCGLSVFGETIVVTHEKPCTRPSWSCHVITPCNMPTRCNQGQREPYTLRHSPHGRPQERWPQDWVSHAVQVA